MLDLCIKKQIALKFSVEAVMDNFHDLEECQALFC